MKVMFSMVWMMGALLMLWLPKAIVLAIVLGLGWRIFAFVAGLA